MKRLYNDTFAPLGPSGEARERILNIPQTRKRPSGRHYLRRAPILAAAVLICLALATTALAASPGLAGRLAGLLGGFAPYAGVEEGLSATDQGITVRLASAMADQGMARVLLEISGDLQGEMQVGKTAPLSGSIGWENDGEPGYATCSIFGFTCVGADRETGTYLVEGRIWADLPRENREMTVEIDRFSTTSQPVSLDTDPEEFWLSLEGAGPAEWETLETGETVLLPGQSNWDIPGLPEGRISSVGFDGDGLLHILCELPEEAEADAYSATALPWLTNAAREEGANLYGMGPGRERGEYNALEVRVVRDGRVYLDRSYAGIPPEEIGDWGISHVSMGYDNAGPIEGEWRIAFQAREMPARQLPLTGETGWGDQIPSSLSITPWSVRLIGAARVTFHDTPCTVTLSDGTVLELPGVQMYSADPREGWEARERNVGFWEFEQPVDPEQAVRIRIGPWRIDLGEGEGTVTGE